MAGVRVDWSAEALASPHPRSLPAPFCVGKWSNGSGAAAPWARCPRGDHGGSPRQKLGAFLQVQFGVMEVATGLAGRLSPAVPPPRLNVCATFVQRLFNVCARFVQCVPHVHRFGHATASLLTAEVAAGAGAAQKAFRARGGRAPDAWEGLPRRSSSSEVPPRCLPYRFPYRSPYRRPHPPPPARSCPQPPPPLPTVAPTRVPTVHSLPATAGC